MADPLSAAASAITVVALCVKCTKQLHRLLESNRNARGELVAVINELNGFRIILEENREALKVIAKSSTGSAGSNTALSQYLAKAESLMKELKAVIELTQIPKKMTQFERLTWLRKKGKFERLRRAIKDNKVNLRMFLATSTL